MCLLLTIVLAGINLFVIFELKRMHKDYFRSLELNRELFLHNVELKNEIDELRK